MRISHHIPYRHMLYALLSVVAACCAVIIISNLLTTPRNNRDWSEDQVLLPYAEIKGDNATVYNIRNFKYASTTNWTAGYYDKKFDLTKIKGVYYIVEPFTGFKGSAHTFLSFEFEGDQFVAVSAEIRKEKGESFSALKGLFNSYELMYVIADERDVIKLRSNYRKDDVYVYPTNATPDQARTLFTDMLERANKLRAEPEFYNTLTNTCTTNIAAHINRVIEDKIWSLNYKILFPAYSDELAYDHDLLDVGTLTLTEAREKYKINELAERYADSPDFSVKIRQAEN